MTRGTSRTLAIGLGTLALLIVGLGVMVVMLLGRVSDLEEENTAIRDDMNRVESGAALFGSQITAFQQELANLAPAVGGGLDEAVAGLETFTSSSLEFIVPINEVIPIDVDVVLDRVIEVPDNTEIPINETIDTTITIAGPFGVDIPLDITVPIDLVVPVDLDLEFPINETVPIQTEIAVDLMLPIRVDIAGTELAALAESLQQGLISFKEVIEGLG